MENKTLTSEHSNEKIQKLDKIINKAGDKNKLSLKQKYLVKDIVENTTRKRKKTNAQLYKDNLARQEVSTEVASVEFNKNLNKPSIIKTLQEVLVDANINKKSILKREINIIDKAFEINQLNTALTGNHKLMELEGMTTLQPSNQTNIQINIEKMSKEEINNKLKDIITL